MSAFHYRLRVYYQDTDAGGVVYHANYLDFAERARTEALRALGVPAARLQAEHGMGFMVRRMELDYLRPARIEDEVLVVTRIGAIGGASVKVGHEFTRDGDSLAVLKVVLVCVRDGRAARLPPEWRSAMVAVCQDEE